MLQRLPENQKKTKKHLVTKTNSRARHYSNYRKLIARYKQRLITVLTSHKSQQERQLKLLRTWTSQTKPSLNTLCGIKTAPLNTQNKRSYSKWRELKTGESNQNWHLGQMTCNVELSNPPNSLQILGSSAGFKKQFDSDKTYLCKLDLKN